MAGAIILHIFSLFVLISRVFSFATFTAPAARDAGLELRIGDVYNVEWTGVNDADCEVSLKMIYPLERGHVYWVISNNLTSSSHSFEWTVSVGDKVTLDPGDTFHFILESGMEKIQSSPFTIVNGTDKVTIENDPSSATKAELKRATLVERKTKTKTTSKSTPKSTPKIRTKHRLSGGSIAGIIIAAVLVVLVCVGSVMFVCLKKRWQDRRARQHNNDVVLNTGERKHGNFVPGSGSIGSQYPELEGSQPQQEDIMYDTPSADVKRNEHESPSLTYNGGS